MFLPFNYFSTICYMIFDNSNLVKKINKLKMEKMYLCILEVINISLLIALWELIHAVACTFTISLTMINRIAEFFFTFYNIHNNWILKLNYDTRDIVENVEQTNAQHTRTRTHTYTHLYLILYKDFFSNFIIFLLNSIISIVNHLIKILKQNFTIIAF